MKEKISQPSSLPPLQSFLQPEDLKSHNEIYDKASLIVQTTNKCTKNCPGCYLTESLKNKKEELDQERYRECISKLKEGSLITLRGGEITMIRDWFEKFVVPALDKNLKIIIESNGYFIEKQDYQDILKKINDNKISIRISFDQEHIRNSKDITSEFKKMARFAEDAKNTGINFGFYSLGMDGTQIQNFVKGTLLEPYIDKFHSLTFYPKISSVKIKGQYLKSNGNLSDDIKV